MPPPLLKAIINSLNKELASQQNSKGNTKHRGSNLAIATNARLLDTPEQRPSCRSHFQFRPLIRTWASQHSHLGSARREGRAVACTNFHGHTFKTPRRPLGVRGWWSSCIPAANNNKRQHVASSASPCVCTIYLLGCTEGERGDYCG